MPYHGGPYPIPKIHKATLMKETDRLISIGVLNWQPSSKWALPSFIIPKKDYTVDMVSSCVVQYPTVEDQKLFL